MRLRISSDEEEGNLDDVAKEQRESVAVEKTFWSRIRNFFYFRE
jgi:protein-S-isoprenylcysteine O-methyltransferase Ste14